jgi:hypothetical protein
MAMADPRYLQKKSIKDFFDPSFDHLPDIIYFPVFSKKMLLLSYSETGGLPFNNYILSQHNLQNNYC